MTEFETHQSPYIDIETFYETRSEAIDHLSALEYRVRTVGGEAVLAAYNAAEQQVHAINKAGEQRGWLSSQLTD